MKLSDQLRNLAYEAEKLEKQRFPRKDYLSFEVTNEMLGKIFPSKSSEEGAVNYLLPTKLQKLIVVSEFLPTDFECRSDKEWFFKERFFVSGPGEVIDILNANEETSNE